MGELTSFFGTRTRIRKWAQFVLFNRTKRTVEWQKPKPYTKQILIPSRFYSNQDARETTKNTHTKLLSNGNESWGNRSVLFSKLVFLEPLFDWVFFYWFSFVAYSHNHNVYMSILSSNSPERKIEKFRMVCSRKPNWNNGSLVFLPTRACVCFLFIFFEQKMRRKTKKYK